MGKSVVTAMAFHSLLHRDEGKCYEGHLKPGGESQMPATTGTTTRVTGQDDGAVCNPLCSTSFVVLFTF